MAIKRSQNWISQQRVDTPHMRSIESAVRSDFDDLLKSFVLAEGQSYVLRGFEISMTGAVGSSASGLRLLVDEGSVFHPNSNEAGTFYVVPSGTSDETLNSTTNATIEGSFTSASLNYIGLEFDRSIDDSTVSQVYLWNPTNTNEITKTLPLAETLSYKIVITSAAFASNVLPLAIVETDASNNVLNITDRRSMLFRLGTAGDSSPDPFYEYPWTNHSEGRVENFWKSTTSSSPFRGGDKQILTMKEWMDAVMSNLLEIKGTTYWYSTNTGGSLVKARQDLGNTIITGRGTITHSAATPGLINWSEDIFLTLIGSRLRYKIEANANSSHITLTDNQVAYVNLVRDVTITPNLIFTNGSAVVTSFGAVAWTGDILAGDYVRIAAEDYTKYYEVLTVDSLSQVTLTEVFAETSTGAAGFQSKYAWGAYETNTAPSTNRHIYIADRETVPFDEDTYWLYVRSDHGDSSPTVFIRFLGSELDSGESQQINDNTSVAVIRYTGMTSEGDSAPAYSTAVGTYEVTKIAAPEGEHVTSGQYFTINSALDAIAYYVWFNVDAAGGDPAPGGTGVEITITSTEVRDAISTKIAAGLHALGDFSATSTLNVTTCTNTAIGNSTDAANVDVDGAIEITTYTQGFNGAITSQSSYNSVEGENLTVRASKLTSMMASKAQDKTIKFAPDYDTVTNTTNAANQDITFTSTGSNSLTVVMNSSANNGTIGLGNTLSLAVNQAAYFLVERNAVFTLASLSNLVVVNIDSVPLSDNLFIFAYRLAGTDVFLWDNSKASVGSTPSITHLQKIVRQNENLKLIEGGTWSWVLSTTTLTWSANAFIQIPDLANNVNRILAGNDSSFADGDVLYVDIKRSSGASDLTVNRAAIASVSMTDNTVVIARRVGSNVYIGTGCDKLVDGQSMTVDASISDQNQTFIGSSGAADNAPSYPLCDEVYIAEGDSLVTSLENVDNALRLQGQADTLLSSMASKNSTDVSNLQTDIDPPLKLKQNGVSGVFEVTELICVADHDSSLDAKYFVLEDDVDEVAFWIDVDNNGTAEPAGSAAIDSGAGRSIEITTITANMTKAQVGTAIYNAITADGKFDLNVDFLSGVIRIQASTTGVKTDGYDVDTNFLIREYIAGVTESLDRVVAVEGIRKTMTDGTNLSVQPIDNIIPTFASGTVTLPAASGGNIVPSAGSNLVLTIANDKFQKLLIAVDSAGDITLASGTDQATKAAAQDEEVSAPSGRLIGEYIISTVVAAVQNVENDDITVYGGGGGAAGGGAGDANTIHLLLSDNLAIGDIDLTGNNADFDGGGVISGGLSLSTTAGDLLKGSEQVINYDPDADGSGDYLGFTKAIPIGLRGRQLGFQFLYKTDTTTVDDDFRFCVKQKDGTNAGDVQYFNMPAAYNSNDVGVTFKESAYIFDDCTEIEFGWQNTSATTTVSLNVDNILVSSKANEFVELIDEQTYRIEQDGLSLSGVSLEVEFNLGTATILNKGSDLIVAEDDSGNTRTKFIAQRNLTLPLISVSAMVGNVANYLFIYKNGVEYIRGDQTNSDNYRVNVVTSMQLDAGEYFTIGTNSTIKGSTDLMQVVFHAQAKSEGVAHSGTFPENNFSATILNNGAATIRNQNINFIQSVSRTSTGIIDVVFVSGFFSEIPSVIVGTEDDTDAYTIITTPVTTSGFTMKSSNDAGTANDVDVPIHAARQGTDYKPLTGTIITPITQTAYIKEVQPLGTSGGVSSTATPTRTLNVVNEDGGFSNYGSSIVTLSANQFTLASGIYRIKFGTPGYNINGNASLLFDITNTKLIAQGTNEYAQAGSSMSTGEVTINISSMTTYELKHAIQTAVADGLGVVLNANGSAYETYSWVTITKLI